MKENKSKISNGLFYTLLSLLSVAFLSPIFIVLMNSFKGRFFIDKLPFKFPNSETYVKFENYLTGIEKTQFFSAFKYSIFITIGSVAAIVFFTSMTAWYIIRVKSAITKVLYFLFAFSMIVPFQMVMFTMSMVANRAGLDNPVGIIVIYLGFGSGLSVFMFAGFVKSIPLEIEEAAEIDGCSPIQTYFRVVFPILKPTAITVAILNAMWIWNDYLLPYLTIGNDYKTIPIAVQSLKGNYGSIDMGAMMAVLVLAMLPIIVFYFICQKHIIKGVVAGAVKG
ncbi:MAG: carbohydrate ABC transporter permease [Clostridiales bacterium]|nr:carbohydrate ABC transporter permease [Clostridiales bacterium]